MAQVLIFTISHLNAQADVPQLCQNKCGYQVKYKIIVLFVRF